MTVRVVVAGNGMAGLRFLEELRLPGPGSGLAVTMVGEEPGGAYNRVQLPNVLAGLAVAGSVAMAGEDWYAARGIALRAGLAVSRVDRGARCVHLSDGSSLGYDLLVLATGSGAVLPRVRGLTGPEGRLIEGVATFRTLGDCERIRALAARAGAAVVLGGGVLGLETARGLAGLGLPVTVLQRGPRLMERQLDAGAARVLTRTLQSLGVTVRTGVSVRAVRGGERLTGVVLGDGRVLDVGLLVLCCGAQPRTELARASGLAVGTGVIVDDQLRSVTDPAVFAIGECAEHRGRVAGLVAPCWAQARIAAQVIAHDSAPASRAEARAAGAQYAGPGDVIRLKAAGVELAALGSAGAAGGAEVVRFSDPARGIYCKLVVRDGRLAGAILLGDTAAAGTLTQLFDRGAPLPADRTSLLLGRRTTPGLDTSGSDMSGPATVCQCNGVTSAGIRDAWQDGARDVGEIAARTRATTGCGTCRDAVEGIVMELARAEPALGRA